MATYWQQQNWRGGMPSSWRLDAAYSSPKNCGSSTINLTYLKYVHVWRNYGNGMP